MEKKVHVVVIPYPVEGHVNPMAQFSKRLLSKGVKVTLVLTSSIKLQPQPPTATTSANTINIERISDGGEKHETESIDAFVDRFKGQTFLILPHLIDKLNTSSPVKAIVYDSFMPWVLEIAQKLGIPGASFFTHSCTVSAIFFHASQGTLSPNSNSTSLEGAPIIMPAITPMQVKDLPSLISDVDSYPAVLRLVLNRFSNFREADWLFFNTFDKLEQKVVNWMASQWPMIKTIGPTVPSMFLDKRLEDDKDYGLSLFKPDGESCMKWLDTKQPGSVVYVSFGSLASLGEDQMGELASGLLNSNCYVLWVVRESEKGKLPTNIMANDKSGRILVVSWCPQLEVLAHRAVGCFVTHCGWNSTLEALSLGVPMLAVPQWTDQTTNAKYIVDVWGAGIRVKVDENGIVGREEIETRIKEVMMGEKGNEIRKNAVKWKELANEAVDEGGSSDTNITEFISKLTCA